LPPGPGSPPPPGPPGPVGGARLTAMSDRGDERVGDADRQRVIDALRAHTGAGRLTLDEFSDLCGAVFAARTRAELDAVVRDLPPGVGFEPAPAVPLRATPATPATPPLPSVPAAGGPARRRPRH